MIDIAQIQSQISDADTQGASAIPPVENWNPPFCGDMNLVIKRNGQWWHEGTPFTRAKLIKLLSSVLKKEDEQYFLVTPVEKIGIEVEDVPFVIISEQAIKHKAAAKTDSNNDTGYEEIEITTQTGDKVTVSNEHPVELREFEGNLVPYCHIRRNLWARVHQNVLYRWVEHALERTLDDGSIELYLKSCDYEFTIGLFSPSADEPS